MSKRRNFLALMAGTASLGVLSSLGKGMFEPQPSYGADDGCGEIDNGNTGDVAEAGVGVLRDVFNAAVGLLGGIKSGNTAQIAALVKEHKKRVDLSAAFWHNPSNVNRFVRGASANAISQTVRSLKGKFSDKQILDAVRKALANLKANNLSAVESDPIIGPVVKAGYAAASAKFKQAANTRRQYRSSLKQIPSTALNRVEVETVQLKKQSKLTDKQIQQIATLYPSLAPALKKAIELKVQPGLPTLPGAIPGIPGAKPGQVKPNPTLLNQLPLDFSAPLSTSESHNKFDAYAQIFDSRLLATATPIAGEADLSPVDLLLGIQKSQAEPVTLLVLLGIVVVAGVVAVVGMVANSDAEKNEAVKECKLKLEAAARVAECEKRAKQRRDERIAAEESSFNKCVADSTVFGIPVGYPACALGHAIANSGIEDDYENDVDACS